MTVDDLLLQIQADVLGVPVRRGAEREATALGAALIAGAVAGVYDAQFARAGDGGCFEPAADAAWRDARGRSLAGSRRARRRLGLRAPGAPPRGRTPAPCRAQLPCPQGSR